METRKTLIDEAERLEALMSSRTVRKVASSPLRFLGSKGLELLSSRTDSGLSRRATTFWGGQMHVVLPEAVSTIVHRYGIFEPRLTSAVVSLLSPGDTFVDVGAHMGYYSLLASYLVGPSGCVVAFEPTPSTFELLRKNVSSIPGVVVERLAAWDTDGQIEIKDFGVRYASLNTAKDARSTAVGTNESSYTTPAVVLDDYLQDQAVSPRVIKIDAENAEPEIVAGLSRTLESARPVLLLEVGGVTEEQRAAEVELSHTLAIAGYGFFEWRDGKLRPQLASASEAYAEVIAVHKDDDSVAT